MALHGIPIKSFPLLQNKIRILVLSPILGGTASGGRIIFKERISLFNSRL
jgi:hypothetical protein